MAAFCKPPWRLAPDLRDHSQLEAEAIRRSLRKAIMEARQNLLILSCESLSRFDRAELDLLFRFLQSQDLSLEAVAYVRDYRNWCESFFQQSVKYGTFRQSLFPLSLKTYRLAIGKMDEFLGRENVHLWKYDRACFAGGCVLRDFYQRLHLGDRQVVSPERNKGVSLEAAKLLFAYHNSGFGPVRDKRILRANSLLAEHLGSLAGPPVRFHPELLAERMRAESDDLAWMEERLGESLRGEPDRRNVADSIRTEEDLQQFSPEALAWLAAESGCPISKGKTPEETAQTVAQAMAGLREKLVIRNERGATGLPSRSMPKRIWIFWSQGLESAPPLVQRCIASWKEKNRGWELRLLNEAGAVDYLRKANVPGVMLDSLPLEKRANILRLRLLAEEGGVWADAATICLRPLDDWLPECMDAGFFCFRDPGPDRLVANWFLASAPENTLARLWRDAHEEFWKHGTFLHHSSYDGSTASSLPIMQRLLLQLLHKAFDRNTRTTDLWFYPFVQMILRTYPYCVMHYIYARELRRNPEWRKIAQAMPYRDAKPLLASYDMVKNQFNLEEILRYGTNAELPLLKMNWKSPPRDLAQVSG